MNCSICGKKIILVPSAKERAKRYGGKPSDYSKLFTEHHECLIQKREQDTIKLMRKINKGE
jgi:hypothetical protein